MRDQFLLLVELQRLDERLGILADEQKNLPQQLQPYQKACLEAREALAAGQTNVEQAERQRRALERDLDNDQARLAKTQSRLRDVKTNKEYSAVLAEIEGGGQRITALEDQVLDLMELAEQYRQTSQQQQQRLHAAAQELERQEKETEQASQVLVQQIAGYDAERQQVVTRLDSKLYTMYQKLFTQRFGLVVVQVDNGTCGGCHLKIQPQLVSEIRRQETLIMCPHCQRMLLWPA